MIFQLTFSLCQASERTLRRQADYFEAIGLTSLFRPMPGQTQDTYRSLPPPIRHALVGLHAEHAPLSERELAQIWYVSFGRRPSHHTIKPVAPSHTPWSRLARAPAARC
jgi:hypothetical protein